MSRPAWDASELALSALAEMTEADRAALLVNALKGVRDAALIADARNALTEHLNDLIADRYADYLVGEGAA